MSKPEENPTNENVVIEEYTESGFWDKVSSYASTAGKTVIEKALYLYYATTSGDTPIPAKAVAVATLAYFVSPLDAIPDVVPVIGYSDDLGAITTALVTLAPYITDEVKRQASEKLGQWFG